jgi:DnaJ-class molecular chaperone
MDIVICNTCEGTGKTEMHKEGTLDLEVIDCSFCKGTGRKIQKQYTLTIPYTEEQSEFRKTDDKIFKLINNARRM